MANQKSSNDKKRFFIPFEVTKETSITSDYKDQPLQWLQLDARKFKGLLIPVSKEVYLEYMRPIWREDKRLQRQAENRKKREKAEKAGIVDKTIKPWDTAVSFEFLCEKGFEFGGSYELEAEVCQCELYDKLHERIAALKKPDRIIALMVAEGMSEARIASVIGMSQKGINKRKHKIFNILCSQLGGYR